MKRRKIPHISIISAIEESDYKHESAIIYIKNYLQQNQLASAEILETQPFNFHAKSGEPDKTRKELKTLVRKIRSSSGILIVASEFQGEYPRSLKKIIDFLYDEWNHKPVAISTVSDDDFHQSTVIRSLQFSLWKVNSWAVPVSYSVPINFEASRNSDTNYAYVSQQASDSESEFRQVFSNYCNKYIQLCTRVEYAV
jgi:NAD(P)H-dependent FMN reductase